MLKSKINSESGKPILYIDGVPTTAMAYTTYFDERSRHEDFINAGYRIFFVNASFTTLPINTYTAFSPFRVGIFENADKEDYSEFENAVRSILSFCPDAIIFPRINIIFFDKREKEITYEQYEKISRILTSLDGNGSKFIKFKDGEIVSSSQIASIRPYEYIVDTRKAEL